MSQVKVRYGPSPTGIPHIGNIRTALFNFLFAKTQKGKFYLRIEDTDRKRLVPGAVEKIQQSLNLLNISWDGEIIYQSKRLNLYKKRLEILKKKGFAYEDEGAWRFKIETDKKSIGWQDVVHGAVEFPTNVIEDFVIVKSDGFPTYHFASVVDDHDMQISHVMRGDEWISSTPKHLLLYLAFGWQPPKFVHLPPILGEDKKKLSKREGAKSVMEYVDEGYLPEALVNFLALLGWAPRSNREFFSLDDLIKEFSLDRINKNSPIFNFEKLNWFNKEWIKKLTDSELATRLKSHVDKKFPTGLVSKTIPLVKERLTKLSDYQSLCEFFAEPPKEFEENLNERKKILETSISQMESIEWNTDAIGNAIKKIADDLNVKIAEVAMALRLAISGKKVTPPLNESLVILGKSETLKRLKNAVGQIK